MILNFISLKIPCKSIIFLFSLEIITRISGQSGCTRTKYARALPENGYYSDATCDYRCNDGYYRQYQYNGPGIPYTYDQCIQCTDKATYTGGCIGVNGVFLAPTCGFDHPTYGANTRDNECKSCGTRFTNGQNDVTWAAENYATGGSMAGWQPVVYCQDFDRLSCTSAADRACGSGTYYIPCGPSGTEYPYYDSYCFTCRTCSSPYYESTSCTSTTNRNCTYCEQGYYCPSTTSRNPCPSFTSSPRGSTSVTACTAVANYYGSPGNAGTACPPFTSSPAGSTVSTQCIANAGYLGVGGATLCPVDSYCPGSNTQVPCPGNTTTNGNLGAAPSSSCVAKPGFYGTPGSAPQSCPLNTFSITNSTLQTQCSANAGFYGAGVALTCNASFYCTGSNTVVGCPPNSNSFPGSSVITSCTANAGYYGLPGSIPTACPPNTFGPANAIDVTTCIANAGFYGTPGSTPSACPPNTISIPGSRFLSNCTAKPGYFGTSNLSLCTENFYCTGSNTILSCPPLTSSLPGSTLLTNCLANSGYYGPAGMTPTICPINTTSQRGSVNRTDCVAKQGFYGLPGTVPLTCLLNHYCPQGSTSALPCPNNTNSPSGSSASSDCVSNQGYYGQPGSEVTLCPSNAYCPVMSQTFTLCPNFSTSTPGSFSIANCMSDIAGYYATANFTMAPCDAGWYCPAGSTAKLQCPTYTTSSSRAGLVTQCTAIAGYYGQPGTVASPCPSNTNSPNQNANGSIFSSTCNSGFKCDYKNNLFVTINLNITPDKFTTYTQKYIVATLADAAAVTTDKIVAASDRTSLGSRKHNQGIILDQWSHFVVLCSHMRVDVRS